MQPDIRAPFKMGLNRELEGLLVVSMDQAVAAPYCALMLADAGARVIKVERSEGDFARGYDNGADGKSSFFAWLNRGKESVSIDLNRAEDATLLRNMVMQSDVFLHTLAPGALAKRGFESELLRGENPKLITCEITGYGSTGQAAKKKAYDFLVQAESGICAVSGTEADPARVGISICDISSGLTAFSAILRALIQRGRTGQGIDISISMFDVMADYMNFPLLAHRYLGRAPARMGLTHALIAPYGAYLTLDGHQVLIAIQSEREWRIFCESVLGQPELAEDERFINNSARVSHRNEMDAAINAVFGQMNQKDLVELLDCTRIANGRLSSVEDLSNHEFLKKQTVTYGGTAIELAALPVPVDSDRPDEVPTLNQHGDRIRQEFQG